MEEELISKKELLERYGISYGALYRWKRKGVIPDEWFIKKSTVTGQETFFPKRLICERMELILRQKDEHSLDELSRKLNRETEQQPMLILRTVFGETRLSLNDVHEIVLHYGDGRTEDLTQILRTRAPGGAPGKKG